MPRKKDPTQPNKPPGRKPQGFEQISVRIRTRDLERAGKLAETCGTSAGEILRVALSLGIDNMEHSPVLPTIKAFRERVMQG